MSSKIRASQAPYGLLFAGIFVVAFATLLFELTLIRVFSFTIWHHFAYVVISTSLLGFGASGSFLAVRPGFGQRNLRGALAVCAATSALSVVFVLLFVSWVPLHPMSILRDGGQALRFVAYQVVSAVPFFFSGLLVSLILRAGAERVDRVYFWDLVGAGAGCALAVAFMNWLTPPGAALLAGVAFAVAAAIFAPGGALRIGGLVGSAVIFLFAANAHVLEFTPARSKEYSIQTSLMGFEPYYTEWTALFRTDVVVAGPKRVPPTKVGWGQSRISPEGMESPRYFVSHDASAGTGIFDLQASPRLKHLDWHILSLPYLIANPNPSVLVIGVGGGRDMITAIQYGASKVTGAELDPVTVDQVTHHIEALDGFFLKPNVNLVAAEGRHFVRSTDERFDMLQITGVDTLSAMNSGAYVLAENYLYTAEALHDYFNRMKPGGMLCFAMANLNAAEPISAGRMVLIAAQVLRERGFERPWEHIAVIDSRSLYAELMIREKPFTAAEVEKLATGARELDFQPLLLPGRGGHPVFVKLSRVTGAERDQMLSELKYLITPIRDDRPFFQRYFRWRDLVNLGPGPIAPNDASALGQIVLALLLVTLTLLGAVFILVPLAVFGRRSGTGDRGNRIGVLLYFLAIGLGFMLFEISLIQRFVLFLGYPTYSLSVTLGSLLVSLGWGSYLSKRWVGSERRAPPLAALAIGALTLFYMTALPAVQDAFLGSPLFVRSLVTIAVLAPLGLVMGMFFPLGIRRAASIHEDLVPWAWGINGCASVTGGVLTVVMAMSFGFTSVWLLSLLIYAGGTYALLKTMPLEDSEPLAP
jgi:hypothetical protein